MVTISFIIAKNLQKEKQKKKKGICFLPVLCYNNKVKNYSKKSLVSHKKNAKTAFFID